VLGPSKSCTDVSLPYPSLLPKKKGENQRIHPPNGLHSLGETPYLHVLTGLLLWGRPDGSLEFSHNGAFPHQVKTNAERPFYIYLWNDLSAIARGAGG